MKTTSKKIAGMTRLLVLMALAVCVVTSPAVALAQSPIKLSLRQGGGQNGAFVLTMAPGESRDLQIQIGNLGSETVRARAFPSDAYTLVNGGFGAKLDGQPITGTTTWMTYPPEVVELAPSASVDRTFTLRVPADAKPGEYQTSLVLQNADPTGSEAGAGEVGVAFKQVVRQALAVSITVPGPLTPNLQIGAVTQKPVGMGTTVAVEVKNTGNVRLKPAGEFTLQDAAGKEISRYPIKMDTVYAGTTTTAEMPFDQILNPGDYQVAVALADAGGASVTPGLLSLNVPQPDLSNASAAIVGPGRATLNQAPNSEPATGSPGSEQGSGSSMLLILLGAAALAAVVLLGRTVMLRRRRIAS